MKSIIFLSAIYSLVLMPSTASAAAPYPLAIEIKKVCAARIVQDYQRMHKQEGWTQARHTSVIDGLIESINRWPMERLRTGYRNYDSSSLDHCIIGELIAHRKAEPQSAMSPSASAAAVAARNQAAAVGATLPSRIIARDGRSAMDCVKLVELTKSDSSTGGGGRVLSNQCGNMVEIGWCYVGGDCESTGSQTNVAAGRSWPVSAEKEIRWAACHGANTFHSDPGSKGLQFTCSAPVK